MSMKVLLADDSVPAQNMGKKILLDAGYEVVTASNGLEAQRKIAESTPDIAILDIFMPGYTGLELCARLRGKRETANMPVILTVGRLEPYRPEEGEQVHSNAVIVKPFAASELTAAVRSLIGTATTEEKADVEVSAKAEADSNPLQEDDNLAAETPAEAGSYWAEPVAGHLQQEASGQPEGELGDPASLVFNPDATHTPFAASTADFMPSTAQSTQGVGAFADFELDSASHPAAPSEASLPVEKPLPVTPDFVAEAEPESSDETPLDSAAPAVAEVVSSVPSESEMELERPPLDIPDSDPLLEIPETVHDAPVFMEETEPAQPAEAEQPEDDEARRLAFEQLFNSAELPPLEVHDGSEPELTAEPELQGQPQDHDWRFEAESATEPLLEKSSDLDTPETFTSAAASDPLLEEMEPVNTASQNHEGHDSLLDGDSELDWATAPNDSVRERTGNFGEVTEEAAELGAHSDPLPLVERELSERVSQLEETDIAPGHISIYSAEDEEETLAPDENEISRSIATPDLPPVLDELEEAAPAAAPLAELSDEVSPTQPAALQPEPEPLPELGADFSMLPAPEVVAANEVQVPETAHWGAGTEAEPASFAEEPASFAAEAVTPPDTELEHFGFQAERNALLEPQLASTEPELDLTTGTYPEFIPPKPTAPEVLPEQAQEAEAQSAVESHIDESRDELCSSLTPALGDEERVQQAVDRVMNRFKRLMVTAIMRELARHDE